MEPGSTFCEKDTISGVHDCCAEIAFDGPEIELVPTPTDQHGNILLNPDDEPFVDPHDEILLGRAKGCDKFGKKETEKDPLGSINGVFRQLDKAGSIPLFRIPKLPDFGIFEGSPSGGP